MTAQHIEEICSELRHARNPPEAFLVASGGILGRLLGVSIFFLEDGQQVPCPGLALMGGVFGPDWGFSQVEIGNCIDGSAEFRLPAVHFETLASGDIHGYRLCIIGENEVPQAKRQLAKIRSQLEKLRNRRIQPSSNMHASIVAL